MSSQSEASHAANRAGFAMFQKLSGVNEGNASFSPFSVFLAMSLAANGASGETLKEIAMAFAGVATIEELNKFVRESQANLLDSNIESGMILEIANAVVLHDKCGGLQQEFRQSLESSFKGSHFPMSGDVAKQVNTWVSEKTRGKIDQLISNVPASLRVVILNAIYMKGEWRTPFKKTSTQDEEYFVQPGSAPIKVPTMHSYEKHVYYNSSKFHAIDMSYKCNQQTSFLVGTFILPKDGFSLSEVEPEILATWSEWTTTSVPNQRVILSLPRFKIRGDFDATSAVKGLGIQTAFSTKADFSKLAQSAEALFISSVIHKAFVEVNESGTEAAAATAIMMLGCAMPRPETPVEMKFNKPFLFTVRDVASGLVLFIVRVENPLKRDD
eukprot:TRINITY_DN11493_c0_g1_i1.p1 TRINITY_DN11493_c0_g1~~TRINITY_DN11493_c0_g1_i1.p1  ORF type:complete len:384 (-),score=92.14 TRINITY_DN11493_c0_g1_i1:236-1387(-)